MKTWVFYKTALYEYLQKKVQKYPGIYYLQRVWRYRKDADFVSQVMNLNHDPNILQIKAFGDKNSDKNIYLIALDGHMEKGLGGYLRQTLYALAEADRLGFLPAVIYCPKGCLYAEKGQIHGTKNPFEYYFEPTCNIQLEDVYQSRYVFLFNPAHELRIEYDLGNLNPHMAEGYIVNEAYLYRLALVFKKYIRLNDTVREKISEDMRALCPVDWHSKKILGVHVRGTDYALNWKNHPNMVSADEFIAAIDEALEQHEVDYIFLATDDKRRLEKIKKRYGDKLLYYKDVQRGGKELNIAVEKNNRPLHRYLSGFEILRDMYTLASCNSLLCGISQVTILTRIIRLSRGTPYEFLKVLDNGIYKG